MQGLNLADYIPIATAIFAVFFFIELFQHWRHHPSSTHLLWWTVGIFFYGAGTVTESINTTIGFSQVNFKAWYIIGALLGAAPLAQGTVYLLLKRKTANILSVILIIIITTTAILVILSPLQPVTGKEVKFSGALLSWTFIRFITPFINIYAFVFLVGGACYSAAQYYRRSIDKTRFWGNLCIAVGTLLPGIGGSAAKYGHVEVLYITEFVGIFFIHAGYEMMKAGMAPSIYSNQSIS